MKLLFTSLIFMPMLYSTNQFISATGTIQNDSNNHVTITYLKPDSSDNTQLQRVSLNLPSKSKVILTIFKKQNSIKPSLITTLLNSRNGRVEQYTFEFTPNTPNNYIITD